MRRSYLLLMIFCVVAAISVAAQTASPDKLAALQTEVRTLRSELIQQRIEFQQWKIEQIEAALKDVKGEREKLEVEERAVHQALTDGSASEGDETATFRTELTETTLKKLQSLQAAGQQREGELLQKLSRELALLQALEKQAKHLKANE